MGSKVKWKTEVNIACVKYTFFLLQTSLFLLASRCEWSPLESDVALPSYINATTMDCMFLEAFKCIKAVSAAPCEIKQCTSTGTWCEGVRRNLLGNGDETKLNVFTV